MKKFLLSLFLFSCMPLGSAKIFAQSTDSLQVVVDSLSVKVAKLEHDMAYLKIQTDINTLDAEVEILTIQVGNILTDYQIAILSGHKKEMREILHKNHETYKENVEIAKKKLNSLQECIDSNKDSFSVFENLHLTISIGRIWCSYNNLEKRISLVGKALDK